MTHGSHARHEQGGEFRHDRQAALHAAKSLHDEALSLADRFAPGTLGVFDEQRDRFARLSAAGWDPAFPWHSRAHWENVQRRAQLSFAAVYRGAADTAAYVAGVLRAVSDNNRIAEAENELLFERLSATGRAGRAREVRWSRPGPPPGGLREGVFRIVPHAPEPEPPLRAEIRRRLLRCLAESLTLEIHQDMAMCWRAAAHRLESASCLICRLSGEVAGALSEPAGERVGLLGAAATDLARFASTMAGATHQAAEALVGLRGSLGAEPGPGEVSAQFRQLSRHFVELDAQVPPELRFALPFAGVSPPIFTDRDTKGPYPDSYSADDPVSHLGPAALPFPDEVVGDSYWDPGPEPGGTPVIE